MKKVSKIIFTIILIMIIMFAFSSQSMAFDWKGQMTSMVNAEVTSQAKGSVENIMGSAITIAQLIGTGIALIMLIVIAIKYMASAPSDKADLKKHAVVYVVGAVILFSTVGILEIIQKLALSV